MTFFARWDITKHTNDRGPLNVNRLLKQAPSIAALSTNRMSPLAAFNSSLADAAHADFFPAGTIPRYLNNNHPTSCKSGDRFCTVRFMLIQLDASVGP